MSGILRQATCIAIGPPNGARAILIEGPPGIGKSSLALALIDRGAVLIGDDGVRLTAKSGSVFASPPPNISGLLEVRNIGLIPYPATSAPVALIITLTQDAPRLPDLAESIEIAGISIPSIALYPESPALHLRAEQALKTFGLPPATEAN